MPGTTVCHYADWKKKTCTDQRLKTLEECGYLGGSQRVWRQGVGEDYFHFSLNIFPSLTVV